jgi:hypothetical protein
MKLYFFYSLFVIIIFSGLYRYKILKKPTRFILLLVVVVLTTEIGNYASALFFKNNLYLIHAYTLVEFQILALAYNAEFKATSSKLVYGFMLFFSGFCIVNAIFLQPLLTHINSYSLVLESLLLTSLIGLFFYKFIQGNNHYSLYRYSLFWLSIGYLIFMIGNLLYSGLLNKYATNQLILDFFQTLNTAFNFILYACIFMSMIMPRHLHIDEETDADD